MTSSQEIYALRIRLNFGWVGLERYRDSLSLHFHHQISVITRVRDFKYFREICKIKKRITDLLYTRYRIVSSSFDKIVTYISREITEYHNYKKSCIPIIENVICISMTLQKNCEYIKLVETFRLLWKSALQICLLDFIWCFYAALMSEERMTSKDLTSRIPYAVRHE